MERRLAAVLAAYMVGCAKGELSVARLLAICIGLTQLSDRAEQAEMRVAQVAGKTDCKRIVPLSNSATAADQPVK